MLLGKGPTSLFCTLISSFPSTVCWRDCPFPIERTWHPYWKSFDHICKGLFLGSLFCSIGLYVLYVCLYASTTLFDYFSFVVSFKIKKCLSSLFVVLFGILLAISGPLRFHMNFRVGFLLLQRKKNYWILIWIALTL